MTVLLLSPTKPLPGLYDGQGWESEHAPSRQAMQAAVFEAGWEAEALMPRHRAVVAHRACREGGEVVVQLPNVTEEELAYLRETVPESYAQMEHAQGRLLELLHPGSVHPAVQVLTMFNR